MSRSEQSPTYEIADLKPRRRSTLPWVLVVLLLAGGGAFVALAHAPLVSALRDRDASLEAQKQVVAQNKAKVAELEAQVAAQRAELDGLKAQLAQAKEDLSRSAAQKAEDDKLLAELRREVAGDGGVEGAGGQITVTLVDKILFKSGEAGLSPQGEKVLKKVGGILAGIDRLIEVSGHTDDVPVESKLKDRFPTNWELSTARATNVVRFLEEQVQVAPGRLKAAGFGPNRPIASNKTATGRAKNRRIEILLLPPKLKVVKGDKRELAAAAAANSDEKSTTPAKAEVAKPVLKKAAIARRR
jgi:chemotaxis protein MotB